MSAAVSGIDGALFIEVTSGHVGDRENGFVQVVVDCVRNDADHPAELTRAEGIYFLKRSADWVDTIEEGFDKGLVDDGFSWKGVCGVKVAALDEIHPYGAEPPRRDGEEVAPGICGRGGIDGDGACPAA